MEQFEITLVKQEELPRLAELASEIWHQHFPPIIGIAQVEYMVEKFQSLPALTKAINEDGYRYYFLRVSGEPVGYIGIQPQEHVLFLSKLYIKQAFRGRKLARAGIDFLVALCQEEGFGRIRLTCNRHNKNTLADYDKLGFVVLCDQDADIGNGFVMNDYIMEKTVGADA